MTRNIRIVSMLGYGSKDAPERYTPARYQLPSGETSQKTPLLQMALLELFKPTTKIQLFGTKSVEELWLRDRTVGLSLDEGRKVYLPADRFAFEQIADGKDEEQLRDLFWKVVGSLTLEPLPHLDEQEPPDEIVLDVTHGFRIQPMIALAAASYVQSEWIRNKVENPPVFKVLYGAFDAGNKEKKVASIWDLTPFMQFARWNEAFSAFERFGRADDIETLALNLHQQYQDELTQRHEKADVAERKRANWLKLLGEQAAAFTNDLVTNRIETLPNSAEKLQKTLKSDDAESLRHEERFIDEIVKSLEQQISPFLVTTPYSIEGMSALAASVKRLIDYQQVSQAVLLMDEALKIYCGLLLCEENAEAATIYKAGTAYMQKAVRQKERSVDEPEALQRAVSIAKDNDGLRKTIAHAGVSFRGNSASTSQKINLKPEKLETRFAELVKNMPKAGSCLEQVKSSTVFLNLSNHPVATWPDEQVLAAREQFGEPKDLEEWECQISSTKNTNEIVSIADGVAQRVIAMGVKNAFVAGEPTFSMTLVACLQAAGIECYCATTERNKQETPQSDGTVHTQSVYKFVQWRAYPDLKRVWDEG